MKATKQVPFTIELAKKIQNKEVEGRIVTRSGRPVRIICYDRVHTTYPILSLIPIGNDEEESVYTQMSNGRLDNKYTTDSDLIIEIPDNEPQFKPFDKVLVRDTDKGFWRASLFSHMRDSEDYPYFTVSGPWGQCIPYEGNEHLLGTTGKPKEE